MKNNNIVTKCPLCGGSGEVNIEKLTKCSKCEGTGYDNGKTVKFFCKECQGKGFF